ncbi:ABC transporter permease [Paenibacillus athensensis]|uniref:Putative hemin transport system permease protein HrtB n=1 Tax=Paenibacillus athensensis TaxID=1967502 RepID=A0A4Y8Q2Y2_9BACL|nr:ABC transporter permease [Paenibacillus athensensis]MCD1261005.1 ABC transporter permease [Paenibacillus athensensis]
MYLALRELNKYRLRFSMIGLIFVLIAWLVFILSGLGNGLQTLAASTFQNMKADYAVFEAGARVSMSRSLLSADRVQEAAGLPGVKAASPIGSSMATAIRGEEAAGGTKLDIALIGIEPGSFLEPAVVEGSGLSADRPDGVIVNRTMKDEGFQLGDTFRLDGSTASLTIVGFVSNQTYNHVASVFTPMPKWRTIAFAAPGADKGISQPVNAIMLQGEQIDATLLDSRLAGTETVTRAAAIKGMPGYKEENGTIMMMLAFLLVISAVMLGVFFYVFTMQKTNQFGIMKAIGAGSGFLGRAVVSQVFVVSLVSIAVGIALTYVTAAFMPKGMPFLLDTKLVAAYSVILLVIAVLSSLVSVRKIVHIDPLQALGRAD